MKNKKKMDYDLIDYSIKTELFSGDQLEQHGLRLAKSHQLSSKRHRCVLLNHLKESETILEQVHTILTQATAAHQPIPPAGEWILDNFYLIEEQILIIKHDLPKKYEKELPQLINGSFLKPNYPRIYDIVLQIIEHGDGRWDGDNLSCLIRAYQNVSKLTLGELWAIPIMLRLALIEKITRISTQMLTNWNGRILAQEWAERMIKTTESDPKKAILLVADMVRSKPPLVSGFVAELTRRLQSAAFSLPLGWIEQKLSEEGLTIDQVVQLDNTRLAANQVSMSNCIGSLHRLREVNWREFVALISATELKLQEDPTHAYQAMDFTTRDRYRLSVEKLSRISGCGELVIAEAAIQLAKQAAENNPEDFRRAHVGFYLIEQGLTELENKLNLPLSIWPKIRRFFNRQILAQYLGCIFILTGGLTAGLVWIGKNEGLNIAELIVLALASAISLSQLTIVLINWIAMLLVKPQPLPKMDFSKGIPDAYKTLVVIPALLDSIEEVQSLIEALEVRFLGNQDKNLYFALLTDFTDAAHEHMAGDDNLLTLARHGIMDLNQRYALEKNPIFFLFHRPRRWNSTDKIWMGYERKRGKLNDLNKLLRENDQSSFSLLIGPIAVLHQIKYVITLDSDTQLPRESARQYVGAMAHPLNVHGILQPRIAEALSGAGLTRFIELYTSEAGIDPYTHTVSNLHQDLFDEGSFIGKGIYDVELFHRVLGQRFPENLILSHDLLEGCYLRSGYISDVPLYEHTPRSYLTDAKRRHRWVRGDWQIIRWLKSPDLNGLSKWKIFDNLRRSLVAPAELILLFLAWAFLPPKWFWYTVIALILILPGIICTLLESVRKSKEMLFVQHIKDCLKIMSHRFAQICFHLACMAHEAGYHLDAIFRTGWRLLISRRHLLEWTPFSQIDKRFQNSMGEWFLKMWMGPTAAIVAVLILLFKHRLSSLLLSAPLLFLWLFSPILARWLSQPLPVEEINLTVSDRGFLHKVARKTWNFFETFVTGKDHWLPPDNYQESPVKVLAHRTSPTNIGLALLANLCAYDFGYITVGQLLERVAQTLKTLSALERYRGHFYNWYDTQTLQVLSPRYISTVDSGNLAGHLLTLRQGLLELIGVPLIRPVYIEGLRDTYEIFLETIPESERENCRLFKELLDQAGAKLTIKESAVEFSQKLAQEAKWLAELFANEWSEKLVSHCQNLQQEYVLFIDHLSDSHTTLGDLTHPIALERINLIEQLAEIAFSMAQMDVSFLYQDVRRLMTIGFNVDKQERDAGDYDLFSSEARLAIFVAIAQGQTPQESWFALGRPQTINSQGHMAMMSWSGSMFEYLMPLLVMPVFAGTLMEQVYRSAVNRQIAYGRRRNTPWGISESGYNAFDPQANYLYRAFGVPDLGFKRGLGEDLVIAPYATLLALMVVPDAACQNLRRLADEGALERFGFYEAMDFTQSRVPRHKNSVLVRSFMAHHQGMGFLALSYFLHEQPMQRRFAKDPLFQATLLLLQERVPKPVATYFKKIKSSSLTSFSHQPEPSLRVFENPNKMAPQVQLLSNGRYHLMLTQSGAGYSRWQNLAVMRWREDSTCDNWGLFSYIRDIHTQDFCSVGYQPICGAVKHYKAVFSEAHAEFIRNFDNLEIATEIVVSPEDDIELRRSRVRNNSRSQRWIEFTSYGEVALSSQEDDQSQPAFSNLFIETELLADRRAIFVKRRPRSDGQAHYCLFHMVNVYGGSSHHFSYETNRTHFIGRGRNLSAPLAMITAGDLSNTVGAVLDPIVSARCKMILEPGERVIIDLITGVSDDPHQGLALVEKYHDRSFADRVFKFSWTHNQVILRQLDMSEGEAQFYQKLAGSILYNNSFARADSSVITRNRYGQSQLWKYSVSGNFPIIVLKMKYIANINMVQQLLHAQAYWRRKGLIVDVFILIEENEGYRQELQDAIMSLIHIRAVTAGNQGGIYVRKVEQMPLEDRILLDAVARIVISDQNGAIKEQINRKRAAHTAPAMLTISQSLRHAAGHKLPLPSDLQFYNGYGGFSEKGEEYCVLLAENHPTPAPWINILANAQFGALVSESGQGYTWVENSHEFRLTPWYNDAVQDSSGEAFYLRDNDSGYYWSPSALPCRGRGDYRIRHGFGYSVFEHIEDGIYSEMWMYVAEKAPVKYIVLKIRNDSRRVRHLSAIGYVEWVLGDLRDKHAPQVITSLTGRGGILAQNHYHTEFGTRTAFFDASTFRAGLNARSITSSRLEFLGRNGARYKPAALERVRFSGKVGAGLDPCAAIQLAFDLAQGQSRDLVFTLGAGKDLADAESLAQNYCSLNAAAEALMWTRRFWRHTLGSVRVSTPDPSINILANGWLIYQTLSSRLWGRTGYYQSSGAFGFRDQLQDVMALVHTRPELLRAQLLLCASRQFREGDVQHWWHPPYGRGIRTRCSDDYLWLPFAICYYVEKTGDLSLLDESVTFLQGRLLQADEDSYYDLALESAERASLYQHGVRSIVYGLKFGAHGLPLMGAGDWNDGMNLVGENGLGESVWLGFFLFSILKKYAKLAMQLGDTAFYHRCEEESVCLQEKLEKHGWDGDWYRRAYFDDGAPLGSALNSECRIDSIVQSWAVFSGAASFERQTQAMAALEHHLVRPHERLVVLLDPPFNKSSMNPGYIKGYVPGIRENGGQYTHAAIWAAMALVELKQTEPVWRLWQMINPINHGDTRQNCEIYKIEPYVAAGDVYSVAPHTGLGGWSWYTGSAGWLYRLIVESLLGLSLENGDQLRVTPCIPENWQDYTIEYRFQDTLYKLILSREPGGVESHCIPLVNDKKTHTIQLKLSFSKICQT